jgi:hypothetical protein
MKKISGICLMLLLHTLYAFSQCETVLKTYTEGTTFQVVTYSMKDEVISTTNYTVQEIRKEADRILVMLKFSTLNKKGKETEKGSRSIIVSGGNYLNNLSAVIPGYKSDDPNYIQYACAPQAGTDIPEFSKVTTYTEDNMGQISITSNKVGLEDGKYASNEEITTPAGTFNCIKLDYKIRLDLQDFSYTEWIDAATGRTIKILRSDKKGDPENYSLLTSFNN